MESDNNLNQRLLESKVQEEDPRVKNYLSWKKDHNSFWIKFHVGTFVFSTAFMIGTYLVLEDNDADCGGLRFNMYLIIALHFVNILVSILNMTGCEAKLAKYGNLVCGFLVFELLMLTFIQVSYFKSQFKNCI